MSPNNYQLPYSANHSIQTLTEMDLVGALLTRVGRKHAVKQRRRAARARFLQIIWQTLQLGVQAALGTWQALRQGLRAR